LTNRTYDELAPMPAEVLVDATLTADEVLIVRQGAD
jgi:hypothetical protein